MEKRDNCAVIERATPGSDNKMFAKNDEQLANLERELEEGLERLEMNSEELIMKVKEKRVEIDNLKLQGRHDEAVELEDSMKEFEHYYALFEKIDSAKCGFDSSEEECPCDTSDSSNEEVKTLEKQFILGLEELEVKDIDELNAEIENIEKEVGKLEKEGRPKKVEEKTQYLTKLKNLKAISEKVASLKSMAVDSVTEELEALKNKFEAGLKEYELKDEDELAEEIAKMRNDITKFEKDNKLKKAAEAEEKLKPLEELQALLQMINTLRSKIPNPIKQKLEALTKIFEDGLNELELNDFEDLMKELNKEKDEVTRLEKEGKHKRAAPLKENLEKLEGLSNIHQEMVILQNQIPNPILEIIEAKEKQYQAGLEDYELKNLDDLVDLIEEKKTEVARNKKAGRQRKVAEEEEVLKKLEHIHSLHDEIQALKAQIPDPRIKQLEELEKKFAQELTDNEFNSVEDLLQEIDAKKDKIANYQKEKKQKSLVKEEASLANLERIKLIHDEILALRAQLESENPKKELVQPSEESKEEEENQKEEYKHNPKEERQDGLSEDSALEKEQSKPESSGALVIRKKKQFIEALSSDLSELPNCAEKHILRLIYLAFVEQNTEVVRSEAKLPIPEHVEEEFEKEFELLKARLRTEELETSKINQIMESIHVSAKQKNWKSAQDSLEHILKKIRPLNLQEMFRLIKKVDNAAKSVKGQDIVLLLGGTGAGKSTTIHFLAGSKMKKITVDNLPHIAPVEIINPRLKEVTTSPYSLSETRYIASIPVRLEDVGSDGMGDIILCDTPGFEDTNGPEVDIANGFGIIKAVRGCKSVKPIVLISYKRVGDRLTGLKEIAHILISMIKGISDHLNTISYFFTKYPVEQRDTIRASLEDLKKNLRPEEKEDKVFIDFFVDMLRKSNNQGAGGVIAIDPVNDNPGRILDQIATSNKIKHPEDVFQFSISEKSKAAIQEQLRSHHLSILAAIKRYDYKFAKYKLDELNSLSELLEQDYITHTYNVCVQAIQKHLAEEYHLRVNSLNRCLENENSLRSEDVKQYQEAINRVRNAESLIKAHLGNEVVQAHSYLQNLISQVETMLSYMKDKKTGDLLVKNILDKTKLLSGLFADIEPKYQKACSLIIHKLDASVESFEMLVSSDEFEKAAETMTTMLDTKVNLKDHLSQEKLEKQYAGLKESFLKSLTSTAENLKGVFTKEKLQKEEVNALTKGVERLELTKNTFALHSHIPQKQIQEIYDSLTEKILNHFGQINKSINTQFQKHRQNSFKNLEQLVKEMNLIRTIPGIDAKTSQPYYSTLEMLCGFIHELKREVEQILVSIFQQTENLNFTTLLSYLTGLQDAKWIGDLRHGVYSDMMKNVEGQISQYVQSLQISIKEVCLDLDSVANVEKAYKIVSRANDIMVLTKIFSDLTADIEKTISIFEGRTNDTLNGIRRFLEKWKQYVAHKMSERAVIAKLKEFGYQSPEYKKAEEEFAEKWKNLEYQSLNFKSIEKSLKYLLTCHQMKLLQKENASLLQETEEFICNYSRFVQEEMKSCFDSITSHSQANINELLIYGQRLSACLEEVFKLEAEFRLVYSKFDPEQEIPNKWKIKLTSYLDNISHDMQRTSAAGQNQKLNNLLLIAKTLIVVDCFLDNDHKFSKVFHDFQTIFWGQAPNALKEVVEAIKKHEYTFVLDEMTKLGDIKDAVCERHLKQAQQILNNSIEQLLEDTKNTSRLILLRDNVTIERVDAIVMNLNRIQNAKSTLSNFIENPQNLDNCIIRVKETISTGLLEFLRSIEGLIKGNNFRQVDAMKTQLNVMCDILRGYCEEKVVEGIKKLDETHEKALTQLMDLYSNMDLRGYLMYPPKDVFAKLEEVKNAKSIYIEALSIMKEKIVETFRKELEKAKVIGISDAMNPYIRNCESALNCLPDIIKMVLMAELNSCKDDLARTSQDQQNELTSVLQGIDLRKIANLLKSCQESGKSSSVRAIESSVLQRMQSLIDSINNLLPERRMKDVFSSVKKLFDYKTHFGEYMEEVKQPYLETRAQVLKTFEDAYTSFLRRLLKSFAIAPTDESVQIVMKDLDCLLEFINFRNENKEQPILKDMLPQNFNKRFIDLNNQVQTFFQHHQSKYEEALKEYNVLELKNALEVTVKLDPLLVKIKNYAEIYGNNEIPTNNLAQVLSQAKPHSEKLQAVSSLFGDLRDKILNVELINQETKSFAAKRDNFYQDMNTNLAIISKVKDFGGCQIDMNVHRVKQECIDALEEKLRKVFNTTKELLNKFMTKSTLNRTEFDTFNTHYYNLTSIAQNIKAVELSGAKDYEIIERELLDRVFTISLEIEESSDVDNVAKRLMSMKHIADYIAPFKDRVNERIDAVLASYTAKNGGASAIAKLGTILNQEKTGLGRTIIEGHKAFQGYSLALFNARIQKHGIDYVLNELDGDEIEKGLLKKKFNEFKESFEKLIEQYLKPKIEFEQLISELRLLVGDVKQEPKKVVWDRDIRIKIPAILAHIFALWTLKNASHYFEAQSLDDRDNYLFQPHAAQIVSIFRMLGIGDKNEELKNNLVQIGTGEGKSIALSITATALALLGFDVSCACYSDYLSQRDYDAAQPLFSSLNLLSHIHYGTFNKMCEGIINQHGDIRKVLENFISQDSNNALGAKPETQRAKILLIDEVDVFFSKDFYGNIYTPSASLRDPTISALLDTIWRDRNSKWTLARVKATNEYKACCDRFKSWEALIEEAVKQIIFDLKSYQAHDYVVKDDKIGYKEQDNIVYNVAYGYKTLFVYYHENENGTISKESLEANKRIIIKCGSFSYAEIPSKFNYIMGVTGTLKTLSDPEKKIIQTVYGINKKTYAPSVFGKNNLTFHKKYDVRIENDDDYFNVIVNEIESRIVGKMAGTKRAVLVFFESEKKLMEFYNSKSLAHLKDIVYIITEEASLEEKNNLVGRTTASGQITLLTRTFGRGTDFVCRDQIVSANGGIHVIQTFLSEEASEEVQIRGRTARQGDYGSFSMILPSSSLEKFLVTPEDLEKVKSGATVIAKLISVFTLNKEKKYDTVYDFLNEKREDLFKTQYENNCRYVEQAKKRHQAAQDFLDNLHAGKADLVRNFLLSENLGADDGSCSRTICLMDATISMSHLLHNAKNTVGTMCERMREVLTANGINASSFQIQFAVYRNYNSKEDKLLQYSPWEVQPDNLRAFMDTIKAEGGYGNEAIEIGLWHANMEADLGDVSQVILIGDAPANTESEVDGKRDHRGEKYWATTRFSNKTFYATEVAKLQQKGIPVHTFFVDRKAEANFKEIADNTKGRCEFLDINSPKGAEILTDLVTEEILRNVGKAKSGNGDSLVEAYRSKYGRSYT